MLWRSQDLGSVILGTAQLGLEYGIANRTGKPSEKTAFRIVEKALEKGVKAFDTAQAYGDSESVLGRALTRLGSREKIAVFSKLAPIPAGKIPAGKISPQIIVEQIERSRERLQQERLFGFLLHNCADLDYWDRGLGDALLKARESRLLDHLGVSAYNMAEAERALDLDGIDMVQLPFNLFDHRAMTSGIMEKARNRDSLLVLRSIYLQGLIFMEPGKLKDELSFAKPYLERLRRLSADSGRTPQELALGFANEKREGFPLVIGAETSDQVSDTLDRLGGIRLDEKTLSAIIEEFAHVPERLVTPSLW